MPRHSLFFSQDSFHSLNYMEKAPLELGWMQMLPAEVSSVFTIHWAQTGGTCLCPGSYEEPSL